MEKFLEKRQHRRFVISLHAKVLIGGKTYEGVIGNVSEEGVSSTITTFIKTDKDFHPQKVIALNFQLPSGVTINLSCEVRWFLKPSENSDNLMLGLKIIDPPAEYTEWQQKFK
ncbi:MAG: PilZ domain-containing protein [Nitrospirae bacterium]|nr:PilZ domain-containing protein [Nitrospirota bacterium]